MSDDITLVSETDSDEEVQAALAGRTSRQAPEPANTQTETRANRDADDDGSEEADDEHEDPPYVNIPPPRRAPKIEDVNEAGEPLFSTYEDWIAAHSEWTMEEAERRLEVRQVANRTQAAVNARHMKAVTAFKRTHSDFETTVKGAKPAVTELVEALGPSALGVIDRYTTSDADNGPAIIYYLAQNPEELKRIARLPPAHQLIALGKLDVAVGGDRPVSRRRSPSSAAVARSSTHRDPDVMDSDDYADWKEQRNKEERARRG
jgi:hypothetical protein